MREKEIKTEIEAFSIPWEIDEATFGLTKSYRNNLLKLRNQDNALTIAKYIISMKNEVNLSDNYRISLIKTLSTLSNFYFNDDDDDNDAKVKVKPDIMAKSKSKSKLFTDITRDDFLLFLNSYRKPEPIDPLHKWIGTYNHFIVIISRFFKWLYYPDLPPNERQKPPVIENIKRLHRKETSIYKPTDLWTQDDDQLFLKYCPSNREKCYHMISRDTGCRPHEILGLRMKDVVFKMANDRQYAEVLVNGKTGSRSVPLINSIPYLKDWIDSHPQRTNPNAYLIFGMGKSFGKKLNNQFIYKIYLGYKQKFFPKLLEDPKVSPEDKVKIKELLKKPWNPYIRRHTALTERSKILKENVLRQYAGWSMRSDMHLKYLHYFGNESNESILEAYGLKPRAEEIDRMKPRQCPNCNELNKIDSKFCVKCRMILNYDEYLETIKEKEKQNEYHNEISSRMNKMDEHIHILSKLLKEYGIQKQEGSSN